MQYVDGVSRWAGQTFFNVLQSLNSNSEQAKERLKAEGKQVLLNYKNDQEVRGDEIKNIVLSILQPVQTLETTGVTATLGFYLFSHVVPWPLDWICKAGTYASAYFTFQVWQAKEAVLEEFFFFEKRDVDVISKEEFLTHADNMADRILAKSSLFRLITTTDKTKQFRDMKKIANAMIESSNNDEALSKLLDQVSFIGTLFQVAKNVEQRVRDGHQD